MDRHTGSLGHTAGDDDAVALDRVRRDLAALGADAASAPDVPPEVTARVITALRGAPAHSPRSRLRRWQMFGLCVGLGAALVGTGVGAVMLTHDPPPPTPQSTGPTAEYITVSPAPSIPLSQPQLVGLLSRAPDYGPLADPQRRSSCLDGLGYSPATRVLGAAPLDMGGRPAVLMLLPNADPGADESGEVVAMVVAPNCSAVHTGLLAHTSVTRP